MVLAPDQNKINMENKKDQQEIKLGSLNLCLGLPNKKDSVIDLLKNNSISVCCLQETEIPKNFPEKVLSSGGYNLELESNEEKKRVGVYLRNDIEYERKLDLEKAGTHIIIIDILLNVNFFFFSYNISDFSLTTHN